ncbi:hypothetical protein AO900_16525 [Pseudomonas aeruginosa]|nr:hypothetical protein AU380_04710 [Pseudomonas aeruginosa]KSD35778.1 hypothetical protein AO900_16525 [Pseudomonas aeruginosa]
MLTLSLKLSLKNYEFTTAMLLRMLLQFIKRPIVTKLRGMVIKSKELLSKVYIMTSLSERSL